MRSVVRVALRSAMFRIAIGFWALLFVLAGRLRRPRARSLQVTGRDHVLVVAPHPDDETLGCGGTLALHAKGGDTVCVLVVTDGSGSRAGGLSSEEMARLRKAEVTDAIWLLAPSAQVMQLSLPEGKWSEGDLVGPLEQVLSSLKPTIIYAPSCVDYHPEHIRVADVVARTLSEGAHPGCRAIRVYEVQVPLTPVLANTISDTSAVRMLKRMALFQYRTQAESLGTRVGDLGWPKRQELYLRLLYRAKGYVEVFWEMTPTQYIAIMGRHVKQEPKFRGFRPRPFTDGLAWVVGWRERKRLGGMSSEKM